MKFSTFWMDTLPFLGQAGRLREQRALESRPGLSFVETGGGRLRVRHMPCATGPRLLIGTDGPNVIEHYDALLQQLAGKADVIVFEPPGTGASVPAPGFDFSMAAFTRACAELLQGLGPRTLVFPCYLGFIAQKLAQQRPDLVQRLVLPQTPSWPHLAQWANRVDPMRILRTPLLGQAWVSMNRRRIASAWYGASTGDSHFRAPFVAAANEAFEVGGCFCLASLMQGYERSPAPARYTLSMATAIVWGARDRTHQHSDPSQSVQGAEVVRFDECGHCPDLEAPHRFAEWLLTWHRVQA